MSIFQKNLSTRVENALLTLQAKSHDIIALREGFEEDVGFKHLTQSQCLDTLIVTGYPLTLGMGNDYSLLIFLCAKYLHIYHRGVHRLRY